jgi:putative SOS response-associated peptidase YedK
VAEIHDRMPLVLDEEDWPLWLGEVEGDPAGLLHRAASDKLVLRPASGKRRRGRDRAPRWKDGRFVCNLYSMTTNQEAIRRLFGVAVDNTGNLPAQPGIFPDYSAPIVRNTANGRELAMARWGMPSPAFSLKGRNSDPGVTNVRNTASPHWRRWLAPECRCVVPFTSFSEIIWTFAAVALNNPDEDFRDATYRNGSVFAK